MPKNSDFKFNCAEAVNNVTADIKEEDEGEDKNVAESIFDCLICRRPFMGAANKIIKTCNRFTCRYFSVKSFLRNFYREIDFTENFFLLFLTITILPILAFLYLCAYFPFLVLIR